MTIQTLALNFQTNTTGTLPEWLPLIPAGQLTGRDGRHWLNDQPDAVVALNRAKQRDIVFDYEHATALKASQGEPAPAAGWIAAESLEVRDGAVWGRVQWNPAAQTSLKNREYRYYSPAFNFDESGRVTDIHHIALTNRHNLFDLPALNQETLIHHHEEQPMALALALAAALGLPPTATDEEAVGAIGALKQERQLALNAQQAADQRIPDPGKFVPAETHQLALNRANDAETTLASLQQAQQDSAAAELIDQAISTGKVAPANRDHYLALCRQDGGLEQIRSLLAVAPKVLASDTHLEGKQPGGNRPALNADEQQVAAMFGNSVEDLAQYGQA